MDRGILYIAFGAPYLDEARRSARSVRESNPGLPIAVITDQPLPEAEAGGEFDVVRSPAPVEREDIEERYLTLDRGAYYIKILPLLQSPFRKTIFLDSDTWVAGSLDPVFDLLDSKEVLVTPAHVTHDYAFERDDPPFAEIPESFGYFNTGFFAFRMTERTERFLHAWQALFETEVASRTVNDQPALRLALFRDQELRYHVIPPCYNVVSWAPFVLPGGGGAVVIHGRNPWLQRWAHHFRVDRPTIIGSLDLRLLFRYHFARFLNWADRAFRRFQPKP